MGLDIEIPLDSEPQPPTEEGFKLEEDLFKTVDGRTVRAGTGEAATLYRTAGRRIPFEEAKSLGLVVGAPAAVAPSPDDGAPAAVPPIGPYIAVTPEALAQFADWSGPFDVLMKPPGDDARVEMQLRQSQVETEGATVKPSTDKDAKADDGEKKAPKAADKQRAAAKNKGKAAG